MSLRSQLFPPRPSFTPSSLKPLSKTYIITGATSGVGLELAKMLYSLSAKIYIAARNESRIKSTISLITSSFPASKGSLHPMVVDLSDLSTISPAVQSFAAQENTLHGLILNAGVMTPPAGSKSHQGHELQMGTNCLGGYALAKCLETMMVGTAESGPGDVRIVWLASTVQLSTPKGGIVWDDERDEPVLLGGQMENYMMSKVGNIFLADDAAERLGSRGIVSVAVNPGFMKTELQRNSPAVMSIIMGLVFKGPEYGAYSELFALLSPEVTLEQNGAFIIPWGRFGRLPEDIKAAMKSEDDGGTGISCKFISWCERETRPFRE